MNARPLRLSEKRFQAQVVALAELYHWRIYHPWLSVRSTAGWPDLALCRSGRLILAELKAEGKQPTEAQRAWLAELGTVPGLEVFVWWPSSWATILKVLE